MVLKVRKMYDDGIKTESFEPSFIKKKDEGGCGLMAKLLERKRTDF